jgi:hypothetical protein
MKEDLLFERWVNLLNRIDKDVIKILKIQQIYKGLNDIINKNNELKNTKNAFYGWMATVYLDSVVMGIRRHIKKRRNTISLIRLLDEIKRNHKVISRDRYIKMYSGPEFIANKEFDEFAGVSQPFIDVNQIEKDIVELKKKADYIEKFADKMIAHLDELEIVEFPEYTEVQDCIEYLKNLVKYYMRIICLTYDDYEISFHDWQRIFRQPWIRTA